MLFGGRSMSPVQTKSKQTVRQPGFPAQQPQLNSSSRSPIRSTNIDTQQTRMDNKISANHTKAQQKTK